MYSINKIGEKNFSLILYCLLNRIPIIVVGNELSEVDDFIAELCDLMHFRKELIYYTDFISESEHQNLCANEEIDYNAQRIIIRCPSNVTLKALKTIKNLKSWVMGVKLPKDDSQRIKFLKELMSEICTFFLIIKISEGMISNELEGDNLEVFNLKMERQILKKISQDTENSIVRMKRVLLQKKLKDKIDEQTLTSLLDFSIEKEEIQKNIFKMEIQNFFSASKRAFFILNRLNLLSSLGLDSSISAKILLSTIDYQDASLERLLSFIYHEWGEDFSLLLKNGKVANIGDHLESLWG